MPAEEALLQVKDGKLLARGFRDFLSDGAVMRQHVRGVSSDFFVLLRGTKERSNWRIRALFALYEDQMNIAW